MLSTRNIGAAAVSAAAGLAWGQPDIIANWQGPNGGLYSVPGHWDLGAVPINLTPFPTFDVRIAAAGNPCVFDLLKAGGLPRRINRLTVSGRTLELNAGTGLQVVNHATICGAIDSRGGDFLATTSATMDCGSAAALVRAGGLVEIAAPVYSAATAGAGTLLRATGDQSRLIFPVMHTLRSQWGACCQSFAQVIEAADNGMVAFPALTQVTGAADDDRLEFASGGGGVILLPLLSAVHRGSGDGQTLFRVAGGSAMTLPALETLTNATFHTSDGGVILAQGPAPASLDTSGMAGWTIISSTGAGSMTDLRALTSLRTAFGRCCQSFAQRISAADGGSINLSGLATITGGADDDRLDMVVRTGGSIVLSSLAAIQRGSADGQTLFDVANPGSVLELPAVETLTNATFHTSDGGVILAQGPAPASLDTSGMAGWTIISSTGAGSMTDLRALTSLRTAFGRCCQSFAQTVRASNGGTVDLSGLTNIIGAADDDFLDLLAQHGGRLRLGGEAISNRVRIVAAGEGSTLEFVGSLVVPLSATLTAGVGTTVEFERDFRFRHTNEASVNLAAATVAFNGSSPQTCEVGGLDFSVNGACFLGNSNFGFGRMEVGAPGTPSHVTLADDIDNGNRAGGRECLYLWGNFDRAACAETGPRVDGLTIEGGATLDIARFNVYAWQGGAWTHLNALFNPCEQSIPFDGGSLAREVCYPDFDQSTGTFVLDIFDFLAFQNAFAALSPCACDCDTTTGPGACDIFDFLCFQNAYGAGCP